VVGDARCPISDTWWQTETGGFMITPLPGAWPLKPGSATLPFFGVQVHNTHLLYSTLRSGVADYVIFLIKLYDNLPMIA
jgi:acyl-coenzyme A synthetase/AMP-(fatty) acid ligase